MSKVDRRFVLKALGLQGVALLTGCDDRGTGPTPSPTPGTVLYRLKSGLELFPGGPHPLSGTITVGAVAKPIASEVDFGDVSVGMQVTVDAVNHLKRLTLVRRLGEEEIYLWPAQDETFLRELVYSIDRAFYGLTRPESAVTCVLSPELWNDPEVRVAWEAAAASLTAANGVVIAFAASNISGTGANFQVSLDPTLSQDFAAVTGWSISGNVITGGFIKVREIIYARYPHVARHEMGHALGLMHTAASGVMSGDARAYNWEDFTGDEKTAMHLMVRRPPKNLQPDNDRGVAATAASRSVVGFSGRALVECRVP